MPFLLPQSRFARNLTQLWARGGAVVAEMAFRLALSRSRSLAHVCLFLVVCLACWAG